MKEGILLAGKAPIYVRWSGPGNKKILKGDAELGYFGIITSNELFNRTQFSNLVGAAGLAGDQLVGVDGWYKFIVNGSKIIYIARSPLVSNVSWEAIYRRGLMYGTDDLGPDPVITKDYEDKNQFMFLNKREYIPDEERIHNWFLKPRNLTGYVEPVSDNSDDELSDWDILRNVFHVDSGGTGLFDSENDADQKLGKHITLNRTSSGYEAKTRGGNSISEEGIVPIAERDGTYLWRPVLELIRDGDKAFEPHYISWEVPEILSRNFESWVEDSFDETLDQLSKYNLETWNHSYLDKSKQPDTQGVKKDVLGVSIVQMSLHTSDSQEDTVKTTKPFKVDTNQYLEINKEVFEVMEDPYFVSSHQETLPTRSDYGLFSLDPKSLWNNSDTYILDEVFRISQELAQVFAVVKSQESSPIYLDIGEFTFNPAQVVHDADRAILDEQWDILEDKKDVFAVSVKQEALAPSFKIDENVLTLGDITHQTDRLIDDEWFNVKFGLEGVTVHSLKVDPRVAIGLNLERPDAKLVLPVYPVSFTHYDAVDEHLVSTVPSLVKAMSRVTTSARAKLTNMVAGLTMWINRKIDFSIFNKDQDFIIGTKLNRRHVLPASLERIYGVSVDAFDNVDFVIAPKEVDRKGDGFSYYKGLRVAAEQLTDPNAVPEPDAWIMSGYQEIFDNLRLKYDEFLSSKVFDIRVNQTLHYRGLLAEGYASEEEPSLTNHANIGQMIQHRVSSDEYVHVFQLEHVISNYLPGLLAYEIPVPEVPREDIIDAKASSKWTLGGGVQCYRYVQRDVVYKAPVDDQTLITKTENHEYLEDMGAISIESFVPVTGSSLRTCLRQITTEPEIQDVAYFSNVLPISVYLPVENIAEDVYGASRCSMGIPVDVELGDYVSTLKDVKHFSNVLPISVDVPVKNATEDVYGSSRYSMEIVVSNGLGDYVSALKIEEVSNNLEFIRLDNKIENTVVAPVLLKVESTSSNALEVRTETFLEVV